MAQIVKKIGGKNVGFRFNMLTIRKYCEERGIDFSDYDKDFASDIFATSEVLFKCAIDVYSEGKTILNEYQSAALFEEMTNEQFQEISECYAKGMKGALSVFKVKVNNEKPEVKKK